MKTVSSISSSTSPTQQLVPARWIVLILSRHWLLIVNLLIAVWVGLPWLAPVFMHWGWTSAGKVSYFIYSFQCHQLPERSYFLFGREVMYSLSEIQSAWQTTTNPFILRQFTGNPEMGWKVAWSDRMVFMYTSILLGGLLYGLLRNWLKPLSFWKFASLLLPMVIDGSTHMISDLAGIGEGFRDTNIWLQMITNNSFSTAFYQGDGFGSFNSWMRLISGILFGVAVVAFAYPYINYSFTDIVRRTDVTLMKGAGQ